VVTSSRPFNNTIITFTDQQGNCSRGSSGNVGFKGSRKARRSRAARGEAAAKRAMDHGAARST